MSENHSISFSEIRQIQINEAIRKSTELRTKCLGALVQHSKFMDMVKSRMDEIGQKMKKTTAPALAPVIPAKREKLPKIPISPKLCLSKQAKRGWTCHETDEEIILKIDDDEPVQLESPIKKVKESEEDPLKSWIPPAPQQTRPSNLVFKIPEPLVKEVKTSKFLDRAAYVNSIAIEKNKIETFLNSIFIQNQRPSESLIGWILKCLPKYVTRPYVVNYFIRRRNDLLDAETNVWYICA